MTRPTQTPDILTVHVPFRIVKRGGRKQMILPPDAPAPREMDNTLVKALARAFRWKRMLESGEFTTIGDLAKREGITLSYLTRVLRLTLLAPDLVEAILDGRQGPTIALSQALEQPSVDWKAQERHLYRSVQLGLLARQDAPKKSLEAATQRG